VESLWLKYTLHLAQQVEDEFTSAILESEYTLGWIEPSVDIIVTQNGYDYEERTDLPLTAFVFEPMQRTQQEHVAALQTYIGKWPGQVWLQSAEQVMEENESWKEEFQAVEVGDWVIAPPWVPTEELPAKKPVLRIDPGAAFGTGYHVTTQDIVRLLQEMQLSGVKLVDIGAGSGILSIFALLNGAKQPVYAIDINAESACQIAKNLALNNLADSSVHIFIADPSAPNQTIDIPDQVDIALVNIGGEEDISMLPFVKKVLRTGGIAVLSGIVEWNYREVKAVCEQEGFTELAMRQGDEWITIKLRYDRK